MLYFERHHGMPWHRHDQDMVRNVDRKVLMHSWNNSRYVNGQSRTRFAELPPLVQYMYVLCSVAVHFVSNDTCGVRLGGPWLCISGIEGNTSSLFYSHPSLVWTWTFVPSLLPRPATVGWRWDRRLGRASAGASRRRWRLGNKGPERQRPRELWCRRMWYVPRYGETDVSLCPLPSA